MSTERDRELRRARAEIARKLHPDMGGDPAQYIAALEALESPPAPTTAAAPVVVRSSGGAFRGGLRRVSRRIRRRKYIDITPS